jgi:putative redox protein
LSSPKLREVIVEGTSADFHQAVHVGGHELVGDLPKVTGSDIVGHDEGPTPYDFLLVALGTCTSMTVNLVARRQNYPLEGVRVRLSYDRIWAEDCATCETKTGSIDHIRREIELSGPLTEEQRRSLFEVARICPVARTLTTETVIEDHLAGEDAPVAAAT